MSNKKTSIGGQALLEGIMMRGPEKTAMTVRNAKNEMITEEWETDTNVPKFWKIPVFRGMYNMVKSLTTGYKCLMRSADIAISDITSEEDEKAEATKDEATAADETPANEENVTEVSESVSAGDEPVIEEKAESDNTDSVPVKENKTDKNKNSPILTVTMIFSVIFAVILMVGLFILLPTFLGKLIFGDANDGAAALGRSIFEGVFKIALLILYMWAISFMKDIRRTFMYHGAEHKTIFCYENGLDLTVENVRPQRRFHPRCGTSFLILMLLVSIIIGFFIRVTNPFLRTAIKILLIPLTVGIGYELIKLAGRHDNWFTKIISAPGLLLQRLTVFEPDDSMIECAIESMKRVIPKDKEKDNW